jgi:hypothetical protein
MNTKHVVSLLVLLFTLGGCSSNPPKMRTAQFHSNPLTWDVRDTAAPRMRAQQRIALKNAYGASTKVVVWTWRNVNYEADLKQFTDTAISQLERRLEKDGIVIDPAASKSITLRVRDMTATNPFGVATTSVTLDAELGDGTRTSYQRDAKSVGGWERAFDSSTVLSVTSLLNDKDFQAYVNRP